MDDPNNPYARRGSVIDPDNPFASPRAEESRGTQVNRSEKLLNPWFSMWTQPRTTIRQIVELHPRRHVLLVAALGSVENVMNTDYIPYDADLAFRFGVVIVQAALGAGLGILYLFVMGWLIKVVAHWFGGIGTTLDSRAAFAWSSVPSVWLLPFVLGVVVCWLSAPPDPDAGPTTLGAVMLLTIFASLILALWELMLLSLAVAEVHQIHGGLGLVSVLIAGLIALAASFVAFMPIIMMIIALVH